VEIWRLSDAAVVSTPTLPLYGGQGFVWFRFWVRPFVPDISKIPESERAYYEDYMLTIFNNPHNIDFSADALWEIHPPDEAASIAAAFDENAWSRLQAALEAAQSAVAEIPTDDSARPLFVDTYDRLRAFHAFCRTQRNIVGWIAGVHGFMDAENEAERKAAREIVRQVVEDELENARYLLDLWESTTVDFIPIAELGESMHTLGANLGDLIRKKIHLMEQYGHHDPYIDPDYMWRMPARSELKLEEYIGY
jgi:hypothetical protein